MRAAPGIEEVEQVTLPPIRPGKSGYWIGAGIASGSMLTAFIVLIVGAFGYLGRIDDLARVEIGQSRAVELPAGDVGIYHEPEGGPVASLAVLDLEVEDESGRELPITPATADRYVTQDTLGSRVGVVEINSSGSYVVSVAGDATGAVALGPSPRRSLAAHGWGATALAVAGVTSGVALIVRTRRRRRRSIEERAQRLLPPTEIPV